MDSSNDSPNVTDEEIQILNVRCVMSALGSMKTEDELLANFATSTDEPDDVIRQEIKRILDVGTIYGFIVRNADKYALTSLDCEYQIDAEDDDDDSDLEYVSPTAQPTKRKYTKRLPEPKEDQVARSATKRKIEAGASSRVSPAKKRKVEPPKRELSEPTTFN